MKKRHWQVCSGLIGAGLDPLQALQNKSIRLNQGQTESFPAMAGARQNIGVSRTTDRDAAPVNGDAPTSNTGSRKRTHDQFIFDSNLTLDDCRILRMAKRQKVNLRYEVYDRGKSSK